jgi:hypothetical protein
MLRGVPEECVRRDGAVMVTWRHWRDARGVCGEMGSGVAGYWRQSATAQRSGETMGRARCGATLDRGLLYMWLCCLTVMRRVATRLGCRDNVGQQRYM